MSGKTSGGRVTGVRTPVLALAMVLAVAVGACGSGDEVAAGASPAYMRHVAETSADVPTARVSALMTMTGGDLGAAEATVLIEGAFAAGRIEYLMDLSGMAEALQASGAPTDDPEFALVFGEPWQVIGDERIAYARVPYLTSMLGVGTDWISFPPGDAGAIGADVADFELYAGAMALLHGASSVTEVGVEDVRGTSTTRYQVTLDWGELADRLGSSERRQFARSFGEVESLEVWVAEDGTMRRMDVTMEVTPTVPGAGDVEATLRVEMWDVGEPFEIEFPDLADVTDVGGLMGSGR